MQQWRGFLGFCSIFSLVFEFYYPGGNFFCICVKIQKCLQTLYALGEAPLPSLRRKWGFVKVARKAGTPQTLGNTGKTAVPQIQRPSMVLCL